MAKLEEVLKKIVGGTIVAYEKPNLEFLGATMGQFDVLVVDMQGCAYQNFLETYAKAGDFEKELANEVFHNKFCGCEKPEDVEPIGDAVAMYGVIPPGDTMRPKYGVMPKKKPGEGSSRRKSNVKDPYNGDVRFVYGVMPPNEDDGAVKPVGDIVAMYGIMLPNEDDGAVKPVGDIVAMYSVMPPNEGEDDFRDVVLPHPNPKRLGIESYDVILNGDKSAIYNRKFTEFNPGTGQLQLLNAKETITKALKDLNI